MNDWFSIHKPHNVYYFFVGITKQQQQQIKKTTTKKKKQNGSVSIVIEYTLKVIKVT